ncbi:hypothetical protein Fot_11175 [Forsythia ovata]|uniref:Uncharacterized protein n=1 Tax=Forsythia ovata TaxID=205694 RepID=A0ABD1WIY5_9LAMI
MLRRKRLEQLYGVINLSDPGSKVEGILLMMAKLMTEKAADMQKQMGESARQRKGKRIAGPSGAVESGSDGESISHRTHRVNLELTSDKMDLVEGWVEYVRELSGGHEDIEAESDD